MNKEDLTYEASLYKSAAYCSTSEHCKADLRTKFDQWGVAEADRKPILDYLTKERYLDESRYVRAFTNDKFRYNKWGRIRIAMALRQKQIDPSLIEEALSTIDSDSYESMMQSLIKEKSKHIKAASDYERRGKLFRFLATKGFEPNLINKVLKTDY